MVEAAAALEVAISNAGEKVESHWKTRVGDRVEFSSWRNHADRMGLRASLDLLVPMIMEEVDVSRSDLELCRRAVDTKNNVVHGRARDVEEKKTKEYVAAIRRVCMALSADV